MKNRFAYLLVSASFGAMALGALIGHVASDSEPAPPPSAPSSSTAFLDAWQDTINGTGPYPPATQPPAPVNPLDVMAGR